MVPVSEVYVDKLSGEDYTQIPTYGIVFTAETSNLKSGIVIGGWFRMTVTMVQGGNDGSR